MIIRATMRFVAATMDLIANARTGLFVRPRIFDMPLGRPFHMLRRRRPQTFLMTRLDAVRGLHRAPIQFLRTWIS